jgi:membrane-bound lytic murein transglycosylase D
MQFAGVSLTIRDDARREIQKDVDALARPGRYFDMKVERARTYFPIIEKVFKEERLPDDFKYLALQESALVPDAVSTSNAVGFWQFKDFTAIQMGLRVDSEIDERMNIVSASRGAAKYLKMNNYNFNNWVMALQSYQMGAGGVIKALGDQFNGVSHMEITNDTYWYVKRFLAHKIAFENAMDGKASAKIGLYENSGAKHVNDLAGELSIEAELLKEYNKWIRKGTIPGDKTYFLLVPNGNNVITDFNSLVLSSDKASKATPKKESIAIREERKEINGVEAILALKGETVSALASRANISLSALLKYNEISIDHSVRAGEFYFLHKKKKSSSLASIRAKMGDDLWSISQQYGIRMKSLHKLNPDLHERTLAKGTYVRLNPSATNEVITPELAEESTEVAELSSDTFSWALKPSGGETKQLHENLLSKDRSSASTAGNSSLTNLESRTNIESASKQASSKPETETIYEVKGSDTLYSVARQFGITIKELMDWNNKTNFNLSKGEKLRILQR